MDAISETKNLSQPTFSETVNGGTVCRKAARTGLWGSGEETIRSTRNLLVNDLKTINELIKNNTNLFDLEFAK
jgi:hypothetical protein